MRCVLSCVAYGSHLLRIQAPLGAVVNFCKQIVRYRALLVTAVCRCVGNCAADPDEASATARSNRVAAAIAVGAREDQSLGGVPVSKKIECSSGDMPNFFLFATVKL